MDDRPGIPTAADAAVWFADKDFTADWLSGQLNVWFRVLAPMRQQPVEILEIGSYEGRSAIAFLEYLPRSHITCIDTFHWAEYPKVGSAVEERFDRNLSPYVERLRKIKARALPAMDQLFADGRVFDIIYLDAGKQRDATFAQSAIAWPLLKLGGILIWDDLMWKRDLASAERPEHAIRLFCSGFGSSLTILHEGYQMIVQKTSDWPQTSAAHAT